MKKVLIVVVVLLVGLGLSTAVFGQMTEQERRIEEEKRSDLEKTERRVLREERKFYIDNGGWISTNFTFNSNDDNDQAASDVPYRTIDIDLRGWIRGTLMDVLENSIDNDFYFYLRSKSKGVWKEPSNRDAGIYASERDMLRLDMAYINLDFKPMVNIRAGRQYMRLGRGIAYNNVHDGVEVSGSYSKFEAKAFVSKNPRHEDNIDYSVPGYDRSSDRNFAGVEATLLTIPGHRPYAYFLTESDNSKEDPDDVTHEYDYDGNYFGLGSNGQLIKDMRYWVELVHETGHSYRYDNTTSRANIKAWALDTGVSYYWNVNTHPVFSMEYAYGSGDNDRQNVTNTLNGNVSDDDTNFLYFGYYPSSFALAPRLSNIRIVTLGASFKPIELFEELKDEIGDFQLGTKFYIFRKDHISGGISDTDATQNKSYIGYEVDVYSSWRILSDLTWSLQYGHFHPGNAYPSANDNENYLFTNLVLSF